MPYSAHSATEAYPLLVGRRLEVVITIRKAVHISGADAANPWLWPGAVQTTPV